MADETVAPDEATPELDIGVAQRMQPEPQSIAADIEPAPAPAPAPKKPVNELATGMLQGMLGAEGVLPAQDFAPPRINSRQEWEQLPQGRQYVDPEGNVQEKPYSPKNIQQFRDVPEGSDWVDPQGQVQTKQVYGDLSFWPQQWYNRATNDKERFNILNYYYPNRVRQEGGTGDVYIETEAGQKLKPREHFWESPGSAVASGAIPTVLSVAGEIGGTVLAGPFGAVTGGLLGGAAGQALDDALLNYMGFYDRSTLDEVVNVGEAGLFGGGGSLVGQVFGLSAKAAVRAGKFATTNPAGLVNEFLGTSPPQLRRHIEMREKGLKTGPISPMFPEAPALINMVERYEPQFKRQEPIQQAARAYKEQQGREILDIITEPIPTDMRAPIGSLTEPTAKPSTQPVGQAMLDKAGNAYLQAKERLSQLQSEERVAMDVAHAGEKATVLEASQRTTAEKLEALNKAEADVRDAVTGYVKAAHADIKNDIAEAGRIAGAGRNPGWLWQRIADKLIALRREFGAEASERYDAWRQKYGSYALADWENLAGAAKNFMEWLPETFRAENPLLIRELSRMAREPFEEAAPAVASKASKAPARTAEAAAPSTARTAAEAAEEAPEPPPPPDLAVLHGLRSVFRYGVNWDDLRSDWFNGALKKFESEIDKAMREVSQTVPEASGAMRELDKIDAWYREHGSIYSDAKMNAIMKRIQSGVPPDAEAIFDTLIKAKSTEFNNKMREMLGPAMWSAIQATDKQRMLDAARTSAGTINGQRFIEQIVSRYRNNMLGSIHGQETAEKLLRMANDLELLGGDFKVDIRPGDRMVDIMDRIKGVVDATRAKAESNPFKLLSEEAEAAKAEQAQAVKAWEEVKVRHQADQEFLRTVQAKQMSELEDAVLKHPLHFLYKPTMGAEEAAEKVLNSADLAQAAKEAYQPDSVEFNMLRQAWVHRALVATLDSSKPLLAATEEMQRLMLPGMSYDLMITLMKEMLQLTEAGAFSDFAGGMAALARVNNPWSHIVGGGGPLAKFVFAPMKYIPGANFLGRQLLSQTYGFVRWGLNHPRTLNWLERGLKSKDPEYYAQASREFRAQLRKWRKVSGMLGAATGEAQYQRGTEHPNIAFPPEQQAPQ
jgi:hypothetical protein